MGKVKVCMGLLVALTLGANAGKNFIPAPSKPIPVPVIKVPLGLYLGGGFTYSSSECECLPIESTSGTIAKSTDSTTYGYNLKAGYYFNPYIGLEAKYFYTPWGDDDRTLKHYGLYLKPTYPVTDHLDVYALLGYGVTDCEVLKDSEKGFGWGVGASYTINPKVKGKKDGAGFYLEYLRPLKKTGNKDITIDTIHTGVEYNW
ncbi:MAG: porin family protein [Epsilonproteobacteria bacterium]|nr:porin family protein [Campylobacterota bacterium]